MIRGVGARDVLQRWLDAWTAGDRQQLERLLPITSVLHASEPAELAGEYYGLEATEQYLRHKAAMHAGFAWEAGEMVEIGPFVVIPFRLTSAAESWWQVAVYRTAGEVIAEIWLHEA